MSKNNFIAPLTNKRETGKSPLCPSYSPPWSVNGLDFLANANTLDAITFVYSKMQIRVLNGGVIICVKW